MSSKYSTKQHTLHSCLLNKRAKFSKRIFAHFWDIVIFVMRIYVFTTRHYAVASETLMVTDYRGHRQTVLPVREINLKPCTPILLPWFGELKFLITLKQFIQPSWGLNQARLITVSGSARTVPMSHRDSSIPMGCVCMTAQQVLL